MTKRIEDLPGDIYALLRSQPKASPDEASEKLASFGAGCSVAMERALRERSPERKEEKVLFASELGKPCHRQVWYQHNTPELADEMPEHSKVKFLYGDLIEEVVLSLAEQAGHDVKNKQEVHEVALKNGWKVRGRQDALIDGVVVDVKSSSVFGMKKFEAGLDDTNDDFGYRQQLSFYNPNGQNKQGILAVDKQNGHIKWFPIEWVDTSKIADKMVDAIESPKEPDRMKGATDKASYGNEKLGINCSYCAYKTTCFRRANKGQGLLIAHYSNGPMFLSNMGKQPNVPVHPLPAPANAEATIIAVKEKKRA